MPLRIGIHIGPQDVTIDELRRVWRFADQHLDWVSVWDHFYEAPYINGESPTFEAATLMAAIAADTTRVRIGCLVFCTLYRNPALLAKSLVTIDHLSGGRLEIGLGAGWHEQEFHAYGYDFPPIKQRLDMLEEAARVIRLLLTQERTTFAGNFYRLENAACYPKPVQAHVPLWIGGRGERRTLRIAARLADGWNVPYIGPEEFARKCSILDEWCQAENRDPATIERGINLGFYMTATAAQAEVRRAEMRRRLAAWSEERFEGLLTGGPEEATEMIAKYVEGGANRLNIALRPPIDWDALHAFVEEVAPHFTS
jgi:F420-dependent oxidoreductase-like protein